MLRPRLCTSTNNDNKITWQPVIQKKTIATIFIVKFLCIRPSLVLYTFVLYIISVYICIVIKGSRVYLSEKDNRFIKLTEVLYVKPRLKTSHDIYLPNSSQRNHLYNLIFCQTQNLIVLKPARLYAKTQTIVIINHVTGCSSKRQ